MSSTITFTVKSEETQALLQTLLQQNSNKKHENTLATSRFFRDIACGRFRATIDVQTGSTAPVASTGTLTLVSMAAAATCVIGSETFTASSTPSGENQFEIDGTDTADATALVDAINAHSTLSKVVLASSVAGVVTLTCHAKGVMGNEIKLTGDTGCTASAAYLASGAGGIEETGSSYTLGY